MARTLVIGLPTRSDAVTAETHWWLIENGCIVERAVSSQWLARMGDADGASPVLVGLAPAAAVRLTYAELNGSAATPQQAAAIARAGGLDQSLGDPETLHAVSAVAGGFALSAVVANATLLEWLDWARAIGVELDHVVPAGALIPQDESWVSATIGSEQLIGGRGLVLPNEPALTDAIVTGQVLPLQSDVVESALIESAEHPPLDLRTGRFAKRRRLVIDWDRVRTLAILAIIIPLVTLLWAIASIVRLDYASDRLDAETLRIAETALGKSVTIENAEAEMRQRAAAAGGSGFAAPLSALLESLRREAGVGTTRIGYRADGTLSASLAATTVDEINRILVALQRNGYRVTAVPRRSPDGRAIVDVTMGVGP